MHFGFALELSDMDLWNIDLSDTHLDLSDTDISSKYQEVFCLPPLCLQDLFLKHLQDMSLIRLQDMSSGSLQDAFKTHLQDVFKLSLQDVFKSLQDVLKMKKCYTENVLNTSSTHVLKTSRRRLQDQQILLGHDATLFMSTK